jgi:hypothetical protein
METMAIASAGIYGKDVTGEEAVGEGYLKR